jgi:ABC-type multidrug transport system ATPase subunit
LGQGDSRTSFPPLEDARADRLQQGLDANTALEYTKIMRALADVEKRSIAVSLYQAGNAITSLFDKILVLAEGEAIYYGPRRDAQAYMEGLGFEMLGQYTAFLPASDFT